MNPQLQGKRINLRENTNHKKTKSIAFRQVRSADTMLMESENKKEAVRKAISPKDIEKEMSISIQERITPYFCHSYDHQLKLKYDWLKA